MSPTPEEEARQYIDAALEAAGWLMQDRADVNLAAGATTTALPWPASRPIPFPASTCTPTTTVPRTDPGLPTRST